MRLPKFDTMRFLRKVQQQRPPAGLRACYVRWTRKVGLKVYSSKGERWHAYRLQRRAAKHLLAPKTYGMVEFTLVVPRPQVLHAQTEEEDPVAVLEADFYPCTFYAYWTEHMDHVDPRCTWNRVEHLKEALSKIGIFHEEPGNNNCARRTDGSLVCIDFGPESCQDIKNFRVRIRKATNLA